MTENEFQSLKKRLENLASIIQNYMGWSEEKTLLWFETPNPHLGEMSPIDMAARGRISKLEGFVQNCIDEGRNSYVTPE